MCQADQISFRPYFCDPAKQCPSATSDLFDLSEDRFDDSLPLFVAVERDAGERKYEPDFECRVRVRL